METRDVVLTSGQGAESTLAGCLARVFWIIGGNLALFLTGALILQTPTWTLSPRDAVYWAVALAIPAVRCVEVTRLGGLDTHGSPVTKRAFTRYALGHFAVASALWIVAQSMHWE